MKLTADDTSDPIICGSRIKIVRLLDAYLAHDAIGFLHVAKLLFEEHEVASVEPRTAPFCEGGIMTDKNSDDDGKDVSTYELVSSEIERQVCAPSLTQDHKTRDVDRDHAMHCSGCFVDDRRDDMRHGLHREFPYWKLALGPDSKP